MPSRIPRRCLFPSCRTVGDFHATIGRCPEHAHKVNRERGKARRGNRVYNATEDRFRASVFSQNPFCQRVIDGVRCRYPALIIHHVLEVSKRPDLKLDQRNVVMVCVLHHPRPADVDQGEYTPTVFAALGEVLEPEHFVMPGFAVPRDLKLWSVAERTQFFKSLECVR